MEAQLRDIREVHASWCGSVRLTTKAIAGATASDLAAVEQEIEQLNASIEQLKTSQEKMVRDNAAEADMQ